jgi:hypothetical protein
MRGEHVGKPGLRIDAVELCGLDQREHAFSAAANNRDHFGYPIGLSK